MTSSELSKPVMLLSRSLRKVTVFLMLMLVSVELASRTSKLSVMLVCPSNRILPIAGLVLEAFRLSKSSNLKSFRMTLAYDTPSKVISRLLPFWVSSRFRAVKPAPRNFRVSTSAITAAVGFVPLPTPLKSVIVSVPLL